MNRNESWLAATRRLCGAQRGGATRWRPIVLIRSHRQESLSRAYIQAIASQCGLSCSFREFDYSIDVTLHLIQRRDNRYFESGFNLDIQAKSTFRATMRENDVLYDMEVKSYNNLRDLEVGTPRILVLLVQPESETEWTGTTEEELMLRHCAYWLSLSGSRSKEFLIALAVGGMFWMFRTFRYLRRAAPEKQTSPGLFLETNDEDSMIPSILRRGK